MNAFLRPSRFSFHALWHHGLPLSRLCSVVLLLLSISAVQARQSQPEKPRILISSDIGGTDPDDNQSLTHLLMYSEQFDLEGLVSSPSFGDGSKEELLRMIALYEQDFPMLQKQAKRLLRPDFLRSICKQGRHGAAPLRGYSVPTEGSEWIVECARRNSRRPLWVLVWGALDDLAQALHDAPDIVSNIRVYWIGGPNKKWGVNSYDYIVRHFSYLWMIENNASYRGFIADSRNPDAFNGGYYAASIAACGNLGRDFIRYYQGVPKMGDSPSLFYMMDGDPSNPTKECWGGRFERTTHTAHRVLSVSGGQERRDTVPAYSVVDFYFDGPLQTAAAPDSVFFTLTIDRQTWNGYYVGNGRYLVRYSPKAPAQLVYRTHCALASLDGVEGTLVVDRLWPGEPTDTDYPVGPNWFTDCSDPALYQHDWQGAATCSQWRTAILSDWAARWAWLKK